MRTKVLTGILIAVAAMIAVGCAEKLTYPRWQTVREGMTADAVKATLGEPWRETDQTWIYYDENKSINVMVYFDKGQVIGTMWSDPEHGAQGRSPNVNQPGESQEIKAPKTK